MSDNDFYNVYNISSSNYYYVVFFSLFYMENLYVMARLKTQKVITRHLLLQIMKATEKKNKR
jgi:hypothetical protein